MPVKDTLLQELQHLRKEIHQNPEISGEEHATAKKIQEFVERYHPNEVVTNIGGQGMIFTFKGSKPGPTVMIRSELDGLAIEEVNNIPHQSKTEGKGHLCGHDGHMSMVAGLASVFSENPPESGCLVLMFQPAEETGAGAALMLNDERFDIRPDYIFALHNLPGFPKGQILLKENVFASASKGLIIDLKGKTSHAAEPQNGLSPSKAVAEMIDMVEQVQTNLKDLKGFTLATIVHVKVGERTFGITPGHGVVMVTLRADHDEDLSKLELAICDEAKAIAAKYHLQIKFDQDEVFKSTINDEACCKYIKEAATDLQLSLKIMDKPFRWSEDFGLFTQKYKGALFGLGSGETTPDLHNPDYDFPDDIMEPGISMFENIIRKLLKNTDA